jgi:hypothetical protein
MIGRFATASQQIRYARGGHFQNNEHWSIATLDAPDNIALLGSKSVLRTRIANAQVFLVIMQIEGIKIHALFPLKQDNAQHFAAIKLYRFAGNRLQD